MCRFGIWRAGGLAGRISQPFTGYGYATAAGKALLDFARDSLGATDVFADVSHGNHKSVAGSIAVYHLDLTLETFSRR